MATTGTRQRLSKDERRSQLLDLGVRLLATRSLDELSIDLLAEEAGISRGLLYHYFGSKQAFHEAVVRRAADDLVAQTAPPPGGDPIARLARSVAIYVDYVMANYEGYLSLVKGAASGNETLRQIYDEARFEMSDRMFRVDQDEVIPDTPLTRLVVRGWAAMAEDVAITWVAAQRAGDSSVTHDQLLHLIVTSLPAMLADPSETSDGSTPFQR